MYSRAGTTSSVHDYALLPGQHPHQQGNSTTQVTTPSRLVTAHFVAVTVSVVILLMQTVYLTLSRWLHSWETMHQIWICFSLELCHMWKICRFPSMPSEHGFSACHIWFILQHSRYRITTVSCFTCWWILKVLEAIGATRCSGTMKPNAPGANYQESVSASLSEEADNDTAI